MEYYTDNSNDRPYKKIDQNIKKEEKSLNSHDYEYWTKMNNKKYPIKENKDGSRIAKI